MKKVLCMTVLWTALFCVYGMAQIPPHMPNRFTVDIYGGYHLRSGNTIYLINQSETDGNWYLDSYGKLELSRLGVSFNGRDGAVFKLVKHSTTSSYTRYRVVGFVSKSFTYKGYILLEYANGAVSYFAFVL